VGGQDQDFDFSEQVAAIVSVPANDITVKFDIICHSIHTVALQASDDATHATIMNAL
jgi:hypothetical protein